MTVEEMARGVVMAGVEGTSLDRPVPRLAGYLLFPGVDAALPDVRAMTDSLRAGDGDPPIVAIDQEGGRVMRIRAGVEPMPAMMALGAADDVELAARCGEQIAFDLRRAGCTLDFAPVLDLALEPQNTVIGTRSIAADPQRVASIGAAFARGLERGGVVPCYKHFPGHGSTWADSHEMLPVVDFDEATLRVRDLAPFAELAGGAPAMMSAHVVVRALDDRLPATMSARILCHLLRDELGFRGALVTDCLEMKAVSQPSSVQNAVDALAAGADLLLFSHDLDLATAAVAAIEEAVGTRVPPVRLQEAHRRVMGLRRAGSPALALDAFPPHPGVGREVARRAVTLVRGLPHADPVASIVISFGNATTSLEREAPALEELVAPIDPDAEEAQALLESLASRKRRPLLLARRAHHHANQAQAIALILDRCPDALVVSLGEPFDLPLFPTAKHLLAAYGDDIASIGGLADVIFGGSMPTGRLPITVSF